MKKYNKYIATLLVFASLISSCKKRFEDMNKNPNAPEEVPSQLMLPSIMLSASYRTSLDGGLRTTELWTQHMKANAYMNEDQYNPSAANLDVVWNGLYVTGFSDCIKAISKAEKDNRPNNKAIALILKAFIGYNLTMLYGDVPYSKAGQGAEGNISPAYDKQVDVFNNLINDLNTASSIVDPNSPYIESDELKKYDIIYKGDMDKWVKFANTLKLRIYLTLNVGGINKLSELNALLNSTTIFTSVDDEAKVLYSSSSSTNSNPVWQWTNPGSSRKNDYRLSNTLVSYMMGSSTNLKKPVDKRLTFYADTIANGTYVGGTNGVTGGAALASRIGVNFMTKTTPVYLISYEEVLFIKAELDTTNKTKYEDAVKASFEKCGLSASDATQMLNDPKFAFNASIGGKLVNEQKWVSLFGQGIEAFNSWRRSGYPKLKPATGAGTANGFVPRRFAYTVDESALNSSNVGSGTAGLFPSVDLISSKSWFDRNHTDNFGNK